MLQAWEPGRRHVDAPHGCGAQDETLNPPHLVFVGLCDHDGQAGGALTVPPPRSQGGKKPKLEDLKNNINKSSAEGVEVGDYTSHRPPRRRSRSAGGRGRGARRALPRGDWRAELSVKVPPRPRRGGACPGSAGARTGDPAPAPGTPRRPRPLCRPRPAPRPRHRHRRERPRPRPVPPPPPPPPAQP